MSKRLKSGAVLRKLCLLTLLVWTAALLVVSAAAAAPAAPTITSTSVDNVGPTAITLRAKIVPNEAATVYSFEYGTTSAYGVTVPAAGGGIGAAGEPVDVSQAIEGLSPDSIYHYRVVASNAQGKTTTEDQTFSTYGAGLDVSLTGSDGNTAALQAGSHPYEMTTTTTFPVNKNSEGESLPAGSPKDLSIELPPGVIGNNRAVPQCPRRMLPPTGSPIGSSSCPVNTQVGLMQLETTLISGTVPLYNLVPPAGVPAELGAYFVLLPVTVKASIRTGEDYGINLDIANVNQALPVRATTVTLWGVPADPSHDPYRGECAKFEGGSSGGDCPSDGPQAPFLTLPTACGSPLTFALKSDAWQEPGSFVSAASTIDDSASNPLDVFGCERIGFAPELSVRPEATTAKTPTGVTIDIAMH